MSGDPVYLYRVPIFHEVVVAACDPTEARGIAQAAVDRGLDYPPAMEAASARPVEGPRDLPEGWGPFPPLGGYVEASCRDFLRGEA